MIAHDILQFLTDLEQKLRPVGLKDRETLLALKMEEHAKKGLPFDGEFYLWDYRYYDRVFIERSLNLDDSLVKEYFPVSKVVPAILDIDPDLEVKGETWHPGRLLLTRSSRSRTVQMCAGGRDARGGGQAISGVRTRCTRCKLYLRVLSGEYRAVLSGGYRDGGLWVV